MCGRARTADLQRRRTAAVLPDDGAACFCRPALKRDAPAHDPTRGAICAGGVAALLTMLLRQGGAPRQLGPIHCITIGTAAVMSLPLAEACREHVTSVILAADIVPKLSYASVEALLLEISDSSLLPRAAKGLGKTLSSVLVCGVRLDGRGIGLGGWERWALVALPSPVAACCASRSHALGRRSDWWERAQLQP